MALKLPKAPKLKMPKLPRGKSSSKGSKLPKLKTPKMPSAKGATGPGMLSSINPGYILAFLYLIPVILGIVVFSKVGIFGAGVLIGVNNSLGFILALIGLILTGINANTNQLNMYSIAGLVVTLIMTGYSLYAAMNYVPPKKEEEKKA